MNTPKLANYSTTVSAAKTVGEIQEMLSEHGAKAIMINYDQGQPTGLSFLISTVSGDMPFKLPANISKIEYMLNTQRSRSRYDADSLDRDKKQAANIAWRILKDWVRAQIAIIDVSLVTLEQVFLPYMTMKGSDKSLYEFIQEHPLMLSQTTQR
jgi:hypothetical protein